MWGGARRSAKRPVRSGAAAWIQQGQTLGHVSVGRGSGSDPGTCLPARVVQRRRPRPGRTPPGGDRRSTPISPRTRAHAREGESPAVRDAVPHGITHSGLRPFDRKRRYHARRFVPFPTLPSEGALHVLPEQAVKRVKSEESGFTLIELLVVLVIIGILLAIAVPSYLGFKKRAEKQASNANVRSAIPAAEAYYSDNGTYVGMDLDRPEGDRPGPRHPRPSRARRPPPTRCPTRRARAPLRSPAPAAPSPTPAPSHNGFSGSPRGAGDRAPRSSRAHHMPFQPTFHISRRRS